MNSGKLSDIIEGMLLDGATDEVEVLIGAGEALRVVSGWTEIELDPDAVYLAPVKAVKLAPGFHVLRPVGELDSWLNVRVKLARLNSGRSGASSR
ncbi:MAG TPA: hypothetical protein VIK33_15305 [Anaerolineae bacterium]